MKENKMKNVKKVPILKKLVSLSKKSADKVDNKKV